MNRHRRGLNSPALTIQRFNESLGEARIPVTQCSDRSVRTWHRTMRLRFRRQKKTDHDRVGRATFLLHPSCSRLLCDVRQNGATGVSNMAGKAARAAVERCGKQPRYNEITTTSHCHERAVFFSTRGRAYPFELPNRGRNLIRTRVAEAEHEAVTRRFADIRRGEW
jgi:hypothetical protein